MTQARCTIRPVVALLVLLANTVGPVLCWALIARTRVIGWTVLAVLAAGAVFEWLLLEDVIFWYQEKFALLTLLGVGMAVALAAGFLAEAGRARRRPGIRFWAGLALAVPYALACLLIALGGGYPAALPATGVPAPAPPTGEALPLGAGVVVTRDSASCAWDPSGGYYCDRLIVVRDATAGSPLAAVRDRLDQRHGWDITDSWGVWQGCRTHFIYVDCLTLSSADGTITIDLSNGYGSGP
jgi:hypothetical protein